jgi:ORF6N domain
LADDPGRQLNRQSSGFRSLLATCRKVTAMKEELRIGKIKQTQVNTEQCRMKKKICAPIEQIDRMIRTIRGVRVMLDRDLAKIYGVATFRFNEAIKRNRHRFPKDFMFQLSRPEFDSLRSQIAMSKSEKSSQIVMSSLTNLELN